MTKSLDITGISRQRALITLINEEYKNIHDFCAKTEEDYAAIYKYVHKNVKIGDKVLNRLATIFNKPVEYFDMYKPNIQSVNIPVIDSLDNNGDNLTKLIKSSKVSAMLEERILNKYGWNKEFLFGLIIRDSSMEPLIQDKAEVVVDSSKTQIEDNKIYAISINKDIYVRKLIKLPMSGKIRLIPENDAFPTDEMELSKVCQVLGKVVYVAAVL